MRETLYEHDGKVVVIRSGHDTYVRYEWPNDFDNEPMDLTDRFDALLRFGWSAPPLPPITLVDPEGERTRLGVLDVNLGRDGSVTVFPAGNGGAGGRVGERLTEAEAANVALRGVRVLFGLVDAKMTRDREGSEDETSESEPSDTPDTDNDTDNDTDTDTDTPDTDADSDGAVEGVSDEG